MGAEANSFRGPKIPKWGFGMAPLSKTMSGRYDSAVDTLSLFLADQIPPSKIELETISEVKGMFNRCLRKDQWDWFTVYEKLGHPPRKQMMYFVSQLVELRKSLKDEDVERANILKKELAASNLPRFLTQWQEPEQPRRESTEAGWLYILSTREQPDILKIGMTKRSVPERVKEINAATGLLYPYSARAVFEVKSARQAERRVFALLSEYRIREDREFFHIPFAKAVQLIEEELFTTGTTKRTEGRVKWFDKSKGYGFLEHGQQEVAFVHVSDLVDKDIKSLNADQEVEFDLVSTSKGLKATRVVLVGT